MNDIALQPDICEQARLARDRRFDGLFFTGVLTTGIFCRPICPAPAPKSANVRYFRTAAAAFQAGLRPCLRCRPEAAPGSLAWNSVEPLLEAGIKMIDAGFLHNHSVADLADRLGISSRHLRRLFQQHLGTTPLVYARMQQTLFAKQLLTESRLPVTDIAMAAAFGSIRRFNDHFKNVYGRSPRELRKNLNSADTAAGGCELYLAYRQPYDFAGILDFYARRAIPCVEQVTAASYARTFRHDQTEGWFSISDAPRKQALKVTLVCNRYDQLQPVVQRIQSMLDIHTDPDAVSQHLQRSPVIQAMLKRHPGLRLPGCWSLDEACVRAVLGQRVSLTASIAMLSRLCEQYGGALEKDWVAANKPPVSRLFPALADLSMVDAQAVRIGSAQAAVLQRLSALEFLPFIDAQALYQQLTRVRGVGDWTANYVLMRGLGYPDAWLKNDVVVNRVLEQAGISNSSEISDQWRPWRAYVLLHCWRRATELDNDDRKKQRLTQFDHGLTHRQADIGGG